MGWHIVHPMLYFLVNLPENLSLWLCTQKLILDTVWEIQQKVENTHSNLKPMYSFGNWWKWIFSLMGFVYRVVIVLTAMWIFLSEFLKPSNFWENWIKQNILGCPRKFYHRVMYLVPSSGHISLNFKMPFKLILRRFEVVFWCLEWECCTFWRIDGTSFKSTKTILWL